MDSPWNPADRTLVEEILSIPKWKRWLICHIFMRKEWKMAKAYNTVTVDALMSCNDDLCKIAKEAGDRKWRRVYMLE